MASPFILLQHLLPQHALSRLAGALAASRNPQISARLIRSFAATYDVDLTEAARSLEQFTSFNDFFTRELRPGARVLADPATHVLSPADGTISQLGQVTEGRIVQAKGRHYTAAELLGHGPEAAARFEGGAFVTIYLSPRDYHRVHMPMTGDLRSSIYVPGQLFSVNPATAAGVDRLFARNERLACLFEGEDGSFASVMVGAMIVAGIDTVWPHRFAGHGREAVREVFDAGAVRLTAGAEMGRFYLGSTVVLLFEPGQVAWSDGLRPGDRVRMGAAIGRRQATA